ncbi:L-threonylcarbamoyladenylate synthase, partial [Vibrio parahaemolyticus]
AAALELGVLGVAAPSANRFGRVSPTRATHVVEEFGPGLLVLDGGACEVGIESSIVDCSRERPALLRPGLIGRARIEAALGEP